MKPSFQSADAPQFQREQIEEKGSIGFGRQRNHLTLGVRSCLVVHILQVRRLAAQSGTVVNNLAVDFARCVIDEGQSRSFLKERIAWPEFSRSPDRVDP